MVRFIKAVSTIDKFIDCLPIASSIKNGGIILYQLAHKVNKVIVKPSNTSWTDDIKIHVLSKNGFITGISLIPIIGNVTAFIHHLVNALAKNRGMSQKRPMGYLGEATRALGWSLKKHSYEVTALYLARNPNRPEEKLYNALQFAISENNAESVKLIFESKDDWSSHFIESALKLAPTAEIAEIILNKPNNLKVQQADSILKHHMNLRIDLPRKKLIYLLLTNFKSIGHSSAIELINKASKFTFDEHFKKYMSYLFKKFPDLTRKYVNKLFIEYASCGRIDRLNWLVTNYKKNIPQQSIGGALNQATSYVLQGNRTSDNILDLLTFAKLIRSCPKLSGNDLEPTMNMLARFDLELFNNYLGIFSQLQSKNLQTALKILEEDLHTSLNHHVPEYTKRINDMVEFIREKFKLGIK